MEFIEKVKKGFKKSVVIDKVDSAKEYAKKNPEMTALYIVGGMIALDVILRVFPGKKPQVNNYIYCNPYPVVMKSKVCK